MAMLPTVLSGVHVGWTMQESCAEAVHVNLESVLGQIEGPLGCRSFRFGHAYESRCRSVL